MRIVPDADSFDLDLLGARLDEEDGAVQMLARIDAAAEAVLDARDPDAAVASLEYDSVLDDDWRSRLRSGRTQRVLAFTTKSCSVDVEVEVVIERRSMTGFTEAVDRQQHLILSAAPRLCGVDVEGEHEA